MNWLEIFVSLCLGLLFTEFTDISPWLARRLTRWAARHWSTDPEIVAAYAEEWTAVIEERPGKLLKLLSAAGFACGAIGRAGPRAAGTLVQMVKAKAEGTSFFQIMLSGAVSNSAVALAAWSIASKSGGWGTYFALLGACALVNGLATHARTRLKRRRGRS